MATRKNDQTSSLAQQNQQDGDVSVNNVVAKKDRIPSREIIVRWKQPATPPQGYQLNLYEVKKKNKTFAVGADILEPNQLLHRFVELKSSTTYICEVKPKYNGELKAGSFSNKEDTDKSVRTPRFDIKKQGKPTIETCSYVFNDPHLVSQFAWKLPDLGDEKNNFKLLKLQAWIDTTGEGKKHFAVEIIDNKAVPIILDVLKNYKFIIQSTYLDIDENKEIKAENTECFTTGIGNPSILNARCEGQHIVVDWSAAKGATKHMLRLIDKKNKEIQKEELKNFRAKTNTAKIKMIQPTDSLVIEATKDETTTESSKKSLSVLVTNVVAKRGKCPWKEITVNWEQPTTTPLGYKLNLYEVKKNNDETVLDFVDNLELTKLSQEFIKLKSSTTYICEVIPMYNGELEIGSFSNQAITEESIGNPSILDVRFDVQNILVDWSAAKGATKHTLKLINQENEKIKEVELGKGPTEKLLEMIKLTYGQSIEFIIEATRDEETRTEKKCFLIGGDESVTKVVVKTGRCPWREILVTWKQPTIKPHGYSLNLYEVKKDNKTKLFGEENMFQQTQLSHQFVELKSSTKYICEVIPIYQGGPKVGSFSNSAVTNEKVSSAIETHADFGKPDRITNMEKVDCNTDLIIELSWSKINLGENYKITGYHVHVFQSGMIKNSNYFKETLLPNIMHVDLAQLQRGQKYEVKFTTDYINLDDHSQRSKTTKTFICTTPSKPIITTCELEKGVIKFSWKSVPGAKTYRLVIKDAQLEEKMVKDEVISNNTVKIQTTEQLGIGKTCMIKVMACANNLNSESEWKAYLIGGKLVPRNVEASRNSDNPKRSILVTFAIPEQGPAKEYKITTLPEYGKGKTFLCCSTTFLVEYLRKGIKYKFHVFAKHGEEWSDGSVSNLQETDQDDNGNPAVGFAGSTGSQFDLQGAHFTGYANTMNASKGDEFGKVRDLVLEPVTEEHSNTEEILKLSWKVPSFDNYAFDYKVEKYKVEVRKQNFSQPSVFYSNFKKDLHEYCTDNKQLELGETYNISVSTIYIDIDQDEEYISKAAEKKMQTRPCQPTGVKCNVKTNDSRKGYLRIEWNSAKGAKYYTVEIHTDESEPHEPLFKRKVEKGTEWERIFDDVFGYGTSYHAVITAIGNENKSNSIRTDQHTIGGDFAPKKVQATITHDKVVDPNTEVYLSWEPPAQQPESYEVTFENEGKRIIPCTESELLITGLKAGVYYTFEVVAIHKQHKKKSGGCISKSIQTNPTPTQVKNVQTFPGHNPSTSINIRWDKVDAENKEESTKYRVNVISLDETIRRKIDVTNNHVAVDWLLPGTKYFTTVAGGNSNGFGKDSTVTNFETELGIPKNIHLLNNATSPDTSLILQFFEAEGEPTNYLGAFNKFENQERHEDSALIDVQPGQTFNNLEPNTAYYAMVLAVFENGKKGKAVKSEALITAPSKPVIDKSGCCTDNKINSSKVFFLKWKSDRGCKEHEIIIKRGDKVENQLIIQNKSELRCICMHEASQYTAQIRTKNITFGQWSDEAVIDLAPVKLRNIQAELDQESNNILIQCKKEAKDSLSYFYQPLCSDKSSGEPVLVPTHHDDENIVKFTFIPTLYAEKYSFKMWAVDGKGLVGESSLSPYVISRPAKGQITKFERDDKNPSTDIDIIWEELERCDEYEIQIKTRGEHKFETCARSTDTSFKYRCKFPGRFYVVCIRGIRESVRGNLSDKVTIGLAPGHVELIEDRDAQEPVESVHVEWKELETKPESYRVILFNNRKEQIANAETKLTHHVFEKLAKPGSLCYGTVAAYNTIGEGKSTKSQNYRIKWNIPDVLFTKPDENDPSRRAKISWDGPDGVNCFRLEIENNQSGTVITLHLEKTSYIFKSGIPGNSYSIRLYSGCDGRYAGKSKVAAMTMKPEAPSNIIAVANNFVKGIIVTFKDNSAQQKSFEIFAKRFTKQGEKDDIRNATTTQERAVIENLLPGESYEISVVSSINDNKSKKITLDGYIQTFPDNINNLQSKVENGFILFQWDPLEVPPDEYIVRLRVNNECCFDKTTKETEFKKQLLKGVHLYELEIAASNTAGKGKTEQLEKIVKVPEDIQNLRSKIENGAIIYEWDPVGKMLDEYTIQWRVNNEFITEEKTKETKFEIRFLKPAQSYSLRVMGSNIVGNGNMSQWNTFITNPLPPRNIKVTNNENSPRTSFIVTFEDEPNTLKKYKVSAIIVDENKDDVVKCSVTTEKFVAILNDLDEATGYYFKVQTIFCGKKSEEINYV